MENYKSPLSDIKRILCNHFKEIAIPVIYFLIDSKRKANYILMIPTS